MVHFVHFIIRKKESRLPSFFYEEELMQLFDANVGEDLKSLRNMAILELLYATGIRVSELTSIMIEDIDFHYSIVRVMGKGRKERIIPFGQFASVALRDYIELARPRLMKKNSSSASVCQHARWGTYTTRGTSYFK